MASEQVVRGATFAEVFGVSEFRVFWLAQALSVAGDRLALVALTVLVFDRTHSPLLTAAAYAAGFLPWVVGGVLFGSIADRWPRREVMVGCDLARAVLVAVMVVPGVPLPALIALLAAVTSLASPFEAARSSLLPDILDGDRYTVGLAVVQTTFRSAMVLGYAAGGIAVAAIGSRSALALDAATFAGSAALVRWGIRARPAAARRTARGPGADIAAGVRLVATDRALRTLMLLGWLVAFYAVPEAVAAPYASELGGGAAAVGLILAASAFGGVLAAPVFMRLVTPPQRVRMMGPLAVATCALLMLCLVRPPLPAVLAILAVSGACGVYQIAANSEFMVRTPTARRGQAFGLAMSGIFAGQGIAFVLAGAAAQVISPPVVVAIAGGLGAATGIALTAAWRRTPPHAAAGR
ncbi:MAG: MFS transporter [Actinobacteria bacterium]|nr:MFS transporter [Actinomycetota bacterium]